MNTIKHIVDTAAATATHEAWEAAEDAFMEPTDPNLKAILRAKAEAARIANDRAARTDADGVYHPAKG